MVCRKASVKSIERVRERFGEGLQQASRPSAHAAASCWRWYQRRQNTICVMGHWAVGSLGYRILFGPASLLQKVCHLVIQIGLSFDQASLSFRLALA